MFPRTHWGLNEPGRRKPVLNGKIKRAIAQAAEQAVSPLDTNNLCKKAQLDQVIRTRVRQKKNPKKPISKPIISTSSSESDTLQIDTLEKDLFVSSSEDEHPLVIDESTFDATDTNDAIVKTAVSTSIAASTTTTTLLSTTITTPATTLVTATTTASLPDAIIITAPLATAPTTISTPAAGIALSTATTTTAAVTAPVSVPAIKAVPSPHRLSQQRIAEINRRARENQSTSNFVLPPIARPPRRAISPTFARFNPGLVSPSPGYAPQVAFYGSNPPNIVINNYYPQPQAPYHHPPSLPQFAPRYNDEQVELMTRGQFGRWCKRNSKDKIAEAVAKRAAFKQNQPHRNQPY